MKNKTGYKVENGYAELITREFTGKKMTAYRGMVLHEPPKFVEVNFDKENDFFHFYFEGCSFCFNITEKPEFDKGKTLTFVTFKNSWGTILLTLEN